MKPLTCDAHVDTLWILSGLAVQKDPTISPERMQFGGLDKAVFALYLSDHWQDRLGEDKTWGLIEGQIAVAASKFPGHFIALEGGRCLGTAWAARLEHLSKFGLKYLTLTHNFHGPLAGSSTESGDPGLSKRGKDVLQFCEDEGILVDVSHASDRTIDDVLAFSAKQPVLASHSGCRILNQHPRNLTNDHIIRISLTGGVVCVPFAKKFTGTMDGVADHIDHICQITGSVRHVGIGSDMDGARMVDGVRGAEDWSTVFIPPLHRMGYSDEQILAIAGGNVLRVLGEN